MLHIFSNGFLLLFMLEYIFSETHYLIFFKFMLCVKSSVHTHNLSKHTELIKTSAIIYHFFEVDVKAYNIIVLDRLHKFNNSQKPDWKKQILIFDNPLLIMHLNLITARLDLILLLFFMKWMNIFLMWAYSQANSRRDIYLKRRKIFNVHAWRRRDLRQAKKKQTLSV